jgi:hypothetical protein
MRRALFLSPLLFAVTASASSPEPDRAAIAAVAETCNSEGAFGYHFGEKNAQPRDTGISPFEIEGLNTQRDGLFEVSAAAWFGKAPMSDEDRRALTTWVYHAIETQVTARRHFAIRAQHKDGVTYYSDPDIKKGFALDLSRDPLRVRIVCSDQSLKRKAWKQVKGVDGTSTDTPTP